MKSFEQTINALTVRQLIYIAVALAAVILIYQHWDEIQAKLNK